MHIQQVQLNHFNFKISKILQKVNTFIKRLEYSNSFTYISTYNKENHLYCYIVYYLQNCDFIILKIIQEYIFVIIYFKIHFK